MKYIVTNGPENWGPYRSEAAAGGALISLVSEALVNGCHLAKYHIEEVPDEPEQPKDVPELIPDYGTADVLLGGNPGIFKPDDPNFNLFEHVRRNEFDNDRRRRTLAFRKLLTINMAWNKADEFTPGERKWKYTTVLCGDGSVSALPCSNTQHYIFAFKSELRARQFGEKFIDLFRQLYGIKEGE